MSHHHAHPAPRPRFALPQDHTLSKAIVSVSFFEKMPHLIQRHGDRARRDMRLWKRLGFGAYPLHDGDIADVQQASDAAEAHVAHAIEEDGQGFHGWRFATRRGIGAMAAAGFAEVTLELTDVAVSDVITGTAALTGLLGHGVLLLGCHNLLYPQQVKSILS
jgi:hypothetical protein